MPSVCVCVCVGYRCYIPVSQSVGKPPTMFVSDDFGDEMQSGDLESMEHLANDRSEEHRETHADRDRTTAQRLKMLGDELSATRDVNKVTTMDKIHEDNVKAGRDKYKTLRMIRSGNTKMRVEQFEKM